MTFCARGRRITPGARGSGVSLAEIAKSAESDQIGPKSPKSDRIGSDRIGSDRTGSDRIGSESPVNSRKITASLGRFLANSGRAKSDFSRPGALIHAWRPTFRRECSGNIPKVQNRTKSPGIAKIGSDRIGSDRIGSDRFGSDRIGSDRNRP